MVFSINFIDTFINKIGCSFHTKWTSELYEEVKNMIEKAAVIWLKDRYLSKSSVKFLETFNE